AAAHLLHRNAVLQVAQPGAAVFFLHGDPEKAQFAQLRPEMAREFVRAVDFVGQWRNFVAAETPHRIAQEVRGVAKPEIERRIGVTNHGWSLRSVTWDQSGFAEATA